MRLATALLLALAVPAAASPESAFLRYRVSPGQAYAHEMSMRIRIRVLSSKNVCPPPPQLRAGMSHEISGRVATLIGRATRSGAHETLTESRLRLKMAGKTVTLPASAPSVGLLAGRGPVGQDGGVEKSLVLDRLPEAALRVGQGWTRQAEHSIPGGPTVTVKTHSRYLGRKRVAGETCAVIEEKAALPPIRFREEGMAGTVSGDAHAFSLYSVATGIPRRATATLQWTLALSGRGRKAARVAVQTSVQLNRVPPTQRERSLARQAAGEGAWSVVADLLEARSQVAAARTPLPAAAPAALAPGDASGRGAAAATPSHPLLRIHSPASGARVSGDVVVTADVAEGITPQFVVFKVDGMHVAAVGGPPYRCRLPWSTLAPGAHTLGVELFTEGHLPAARASLRVRALP